MTGRLEQIKTLCIYGGGGMGREVADLSHKIGKWQKTIFVVDSVANRVVDGNKVYAFKEIVKQFENAGLEFIVAVGEPALRKSLYEKLDAHKFNYIKFMAPGFVLSRLSSVAAGTIIHTGVVATVNVHIEKGCLINKQAVIGHDVTIGEYSVVSPNATIGGNVNIASGCYLGSGSIIRNGINIGENSIIGMGAVVLEDVEANSVMAGNPARFLRKNLDKRVFR